MFIVIGMFVLAVVVAVVLPMAQRAAADPFIDMPPERVAYIEHGDARYNKFSDTNDVTVGNFLRTSDPGQILAGDNRIAEVSRTSELLPDPTSPTYLGVEANVPNLRIPPANNIMKTAEKCEKVKGRGACDQLGTEALRGCGVCIKGGTSYFDPDNQGKHIGGLTLLDDDRQAAEEAAAGTGKDTVYGPTVGECPPGYFFVDRTKCEKAARREICKEYGEAGGFNGSTDADCAATIGGGYVYDSKNRNFPLYLRIVTPKTSNSTTVTVYNSSGNTVGSSTGSNGSEFRLMIPNVKEGDNLKIAVDMPESYTPYTGAAALRAVIIQYESTDGRRVSRIESSITKLNGVMRDTEGNISVMRKYGTYASSGVILLPRPSSGSKILTDSAWFWGAGGGAKLTLDISVPGTFLDPVYSEDNVLTPSGALISKKSTFDMLRISPCEKADQKPGKYSLACLKTLFTSAGGDPYRGKLANDGMLELNKIGDGTAASISTYLDGLYNIATRGKTREGMKATMTEINDAAMKMFGFELVSPCEDIYEDERGTIGLMPKVGGLDADCLDYLWTNTGNDRSRGDEDRSRNTSLKNTYVSIFDRYSGLRAGEGSAAERAAAPFATCTRAGTLSPKNTRGAVNAGAASLANSKGGVAAVQDFYNSVYKAANYKGGSAATKEEHASALLQCYGIQRNGDIDSNRIKCLKPSLINIGSRISLSSAANTSLFVRHAGFVMWTHVNDRSNLFMNDATFKVVSPIGGSADCISLESVNFPGYYVVHYNFRIRIFPVGANLDFNGNPGRRDGDWKVQAGKNGAADTVSFLSANYGNNYYIGKNGDQVQLLSYNMWNANDLSWIVLPGLI